MRKEKQPLKNFFARALLLLAVFVAGGLFLAETQLNDLTLESEFSQVLNIRRSRVAETALEIYIFGEVFAVRREDYAAAAAQTEAYWEAAGALLGDWERQARRYYTEFF